MSTLSMAEAMQEFLNRSRLKSGIQSVQVEEVWEEIMGKTIAKYTDKIQIVKDTLFVTTNVAALKNELLYQKENIIKLINDKMGSRIIKHVVIR